LDDFKFEIDQFANADTSILEDLDGIRQRKETRIAGIITSASHLTSKTGSPYGRFVLEDYKGSHEFVLFKDDYIKFKSYLTQDWFVLIHVVIGGWYSKRDQKEVLRLNVKKIDLLSDLRDKLVKQINIDVLLKNINEPMISRIRTLCKKHKGNIPIQVNVHDEDTILEMPSRSLRVNMTREMTEELERLENLSWSIKKN